jgi:hypothetical protein
MSTPSEKLARAKAQPRKFLDVEILLDSGLSEQRDALEAKLTEAIKADAADQRLSSEDPAIADLRAQIDALLDAAADDIAIIRITALPGHVWSDIERRSPVRTDAPGDMYFGFNTLAAAKLALPLCAGWLVDGEVVPLVVTLGDPQNDVPAVDEWADLFETISGTESSTLESAVWQVNVADPQVAIADAKKASRTLPA